MHDSCWFYILSVWNLFKSIFNFNSLSLQKVQVYKEEPAIAEKVQKVTLNCLALKDSLLFPILQVNNL